MRRVATTAAAATAAAVLSLGLVLPQVVHPEPLPTLRNGADWRDRPPFVPASLGSRLLRPVEDAAWLARGGAPLEPSRRRLVAGALADLHGLTRDTGAVAAGPDAPWAYAWPRDSAFVAAAYAVSGHEDDAWRVWRFLARVQRRDGGFEARYRLDGSGPPDDRPPQTDGAGWVLWGLDATRTGTGVRVLPADLRALRDRAVRFALDQTADGHRLPAPTPDYWEVPEGRVTLGTAAPLAAGLEAAARSLAAEGSSTAAARCSAAAARLRALVRSTFGPTYERHGSSGGLDAAVAMLMPPFATLDDAAAVRAWERYPVLALREAGGLAPGAGWKSDGVSWTPETALVAYTAAASGRVELAERWLGWLEGHCTAWGSLPEKVLPDGRPAGPAPLAWTAALVVLTEHELESRQAVLPAG
jgi:GH15 family glucan-1,4-alpha-glucosidase